MRTTNSGKERPRSPDLATDSSINLGWPRPSTRRFAFYPPDRKNGRVKSFPRPRKRGVGRRVGKIQRIRTASQHGLIEFPITDILLYTIIPNLWNYSFPSLFHLCVLSSLLFSFSLFSSVPSFSSAREEKKSVSKWLEIGGNHGTSLLANGLEGGVFGTIFPSSQGRRNERKKDTVHRKTVKRLRHGVIKVKWILPFLLLLLLSLPLLLLPSPPLLLLSPLRR